MALAYAGFAIHQFFLALVGFIVGAALGLAISSAVVIGSINSISEAGWLLDQGGLVLLGSIAVALITGLFGAGLVIVLQTAIVAFLGFLGTDIVAASLLGVELGHPLPLLVGIAGAVLLWKVYIGTIIVLTAAAGAMITSMVTTSVALPFLSPLYRTFGSVLLPVFVSGIIVQAGLYKIVGLPESTRELFEEDVLMESGRLHSGPVDLMGSEETGGKNKNPDHCTTCDISFYQGQRYCYECGDETPLNIRNVANMDTKGIDAGQVYEATEKFCAECGVPARDAPNYCYYCGIERSVRTTSSTPVFPRPKNPPRVVQSQSAK